jgi:hypothetical protein
MVDISFIDLSFNLLEGSIPLPGPVTQLLDCSNNRFSSMPLNFGSQASSIWYFKANANTLSGKIPQTICEAKNLLLIDLSDNSLSGSIPSCLMEGTLTVLNLKRNQLHGELPNNMNQNCAFKEFDLSVNQIEGKLPRSLVACRDLEVFNIGNNHINDTFPCWMGMLPKLQVITELPLDVEPVLQRVGGENTRLTSLLDIYQLLVSGQHWPLLGFRCPEHATTQHHMWSYTIQRRNPSTLCY